MNILVVEDNADLRRAFVNRLAGLYWAGKLGEGNVGRVVEK